MAVCILCDYPAIEEQPDFPNLVRITSDSRIWHKGGRLGICPHCHSVQKPADTDFLKETHEIYDSYQIYFQSHGKEQKIFTDNATKPRSEILLDQLFSLRSFLDHCSVLDVGCGAGNLLQALSLRKPQWHLHGADLNDHNRQAILSIKAVQDFFSGDIAAIEKKFDIIFISHVLEHIPTPKQFLKQLAGLLNPDGVLVILVPNWADNFFDLLVADHCIHFTGDSLRRLLQEKGFSVVAESSAIIPKELFFAVELGGEQSSKTVAMPVSDTKLMMDGAIQWLLKTRNWAMEIKKQKMEMGIFGTALAATWLTHAAGLEPDFFVDEDSDRQGLAYLGRPVKSPADVPPDSRVLVPLPLAIAEKIVSRLNHGRKASIFLAPPL